MVRRRWIEGELAALRVPDLRLAVEPAEAPTVRLASERWMAARVDVSAGTIQTYRVALGRILPRLGTERLDRIDAQRVAALVAELHAEGLKKQTIRKTVSVLAMVLDHARIEPNPARDKLTVKLPREERRIVEPPTGDGQAIEMPDFDCDTLGLATLRTAVSVGQSHSLISAARSQAVFVGPLC